ncbi:Retrovirus-related Pol polyprotein from transposon TNT 1-94 [Dendrobium catenatum]|uniref:Retrovirus-related Pol polyprotein from transposon TNT 1-94 n=1 Tax=Dendrobium catenatum TaxID=906689 RepID=A0A2I0X8D2_9ASPA|nr:Retrovirus-related Pol polyprotein from transposon TNT 1-94 [Dendrobium catenatum]
MDDSSSSPQISASTARTSSESSGLPSSLKFVLANLKNFVHSPLSPDNYPVWRSQILKILRANSLESFLDSTVPIPPKNVTTSDGLTATNPSYLNWVFTDQNLAAAICATISSPVLPYILNLETTSSIWSTLETRFQSTNRSRVIQLKNELHNISLKNSTMIQYLNEVKSIVDKIAAAGSNVDTEDIILYILNGLPATYQAFKTSIRTMLTPLTLDQLYPLLISEEINIAADTARITSTDAQMALFASRGRGRRSRNRFTSSTNNSTKEQSNKIPTTCQICLKRGHNATDCWHRLNPQYLPKSTSTPTTALRANSSQNHTDWYLDSGASSHMTNSLENLSISTPYRGSDSITIGDGSSVSIENSGKGLLPTPSRKLSLSHILHSPFLQYNLLSISKLTRDNNLAITFDPHGFSFKDLTTSKIILQGPCSAGLYTIRTPSPTATNPALHSTVHGSDPWHDRMGHPSKQILASIAARNQQLNIGFNSFSCHWCNTNKSHKLPFPISASRKIASLDLIHSDVWGPAPMASVTGYLYYVIFVDDYSRFTWLFPMFHKSEVYNIFVAFKTQIENLTSRKIKSIRTDGGGEYMSNKFTQFLQTNGITHQISCPHTPEQNGVAERKYRHIIETTRTILHRASLPYKFWPDAVLTSVYLINRMPASTTNNYSPFELLHNQKPDYSHLRIFGCACYPLIPSSQRHKLQQTADCCVLLGYSDTYKGYKCLNINTNKTILSRHVKFDEHYFPYHSNNSDIPVQESTISPLLLTPSSVHSQPSVVNSPPTAAAQHNAVSSTPTQTQPSRVSATNSQSASLQNNAPVQQPSHPMVTRFRTGSLKPTVRLNLLHTNSTPDLAHDPTSYHEASKHNVWRTAMASEFFALQQQGTWTLVPLPANCSALGCRWTYRTKTHSDGSIAKHKARLVAQGNHQEYGLDFTETFSPVAKLPTIRVLLAIAIHHDWPVQQLDVANAFLHGKLTETVYMRQPKGFEDSTHPDYVCHLQKAIYGLRQAPRQWYNTFTSTLVSMGFSHSTADPSLLILHDNSIRIYLLIYVDDILITGNNTQAITNILAKLDIKFAMKNLGEAHNFLGIQINRSENTFFLSQRLYALSILKTANLSNCNKLSNPTCTKLPLDIQPDQHLSDPILYRKLTGSLQYLTLTRPDIAYSVNQLSQHMHQPENQHIYLLKRLLRYIQGTSDFGIPITKSNLCLTSFSDADWAGDPISRKSTLDTAPFLATLSFPGPSRNKTRWLVPLPSLNTERLQHSFQTLSGSDGCSLISANLPNNRLTSIVTTRLLSRSQITRCSTLAQNT